MTSEHGTPIDAPCFTDYALQEYVLERLSEQVSCEIKQHISVCEACRRMEADIRLEDQYFAQLSKGDSVPSSLDCIDELELGKFLDDSLSNTDRMVIETHIASCTPCRRRLIALRRNVQDAQNDNFEPQIDTDLRPSSKPMLVLTMSKREVLSQSEQLPHFPMRETGTDV